MAQKLMKLKIHPRTFCEEELIVNVDALSRDKFQVAVGDIIEISVPDEGASKSSVCLQVTAVPQDLQTKGGPLSVNKELAQLYNLEGVKEVNVRKVDKEEVGIDLLELKFKDQCLTRSDMWRFTCSLIGKCVYLTKKLEFVTIRTQVSGLWSQGEEVHCGAVVNETRVVFRSASSQMFLLIQISSEMWEFDTSGDLYFDKLVGGFLKELFHCWGEEGCSHEVTLAFFWRVYYQPDQLDKLPESACQHIQKDKRSIYYEDFYKVIVEAESVSDWNSKVTEIKRSFIQLKDTLCNARGEDVEISSSAEGNFLEAINLAINVFDKGYIDCNFMLTGQQIAIVTAGVGVFEVDHDLTRMTKERIIDGGIGVDLVCLTEQPLHAVPLFRFHQSTTLDDQEYYHIPHWINYSFYNPLRFWNRFQFRPQLQISDHLINIHLMRGERRTKGTKLYNSFSGAPKLSHAPRSPEPPQLMKTLLDDRLQDSEVYDEVIFTSCFNDPLPNKAISLNKVQSAGKIHSSGHPSTKSLGASMLMRHYSPEKKNMAGSYHDVKFEIGESPPDPFDDRLGVLGVSPGSRSTGGIDWRARDFTSSVQPISRRSRVRSDSEYPEPSSSFKNSSSFYGSFTRTGSAESARGMVTPRGGARSRGLNTPLGPHRRGFFINPFDSSKMHTEITAYHRRWMHTFPRNREGFLFQIHHAILEELAETSSLGSQTPSSMSRQSSVSSIHMAVGAEEGTISQLRRRMHRGSMSLDERDRDASRNSEATPPSRGSGERLKDGGRGSGERLKDGGRGSGERLRDGGHTTATTSTAYYGGSRQEDSVRNLDKETASLDVRNRDSRSHSGEKLPVQSLDVNALKALKQGGSPKSSQHHTVGDGVNGGNVKAKQAVAPDKKPVDLRKLAEDFASVRRTGVDWKSLTEPACLPITTDYFPPKPKLVNDYYEHPSKLLVSSYNYGEEEFPEGKTTLPWRTNHQHMTTFKAFQEMISQRLTQGFQLVFDTPCDKSMVGGDSRGRMRTGGHDSVFSLHQAIKEQKEAIYSKTKSRRGRRHGDIAARFSLGRVFHKVELAYPDLVISIYKSKGHHTTNKLSYSYQLCGLTSDPTLGDGFQPMTTVFHHTRVEDYNWNYLDQHICGHSDFEELGESQKYCRCRYLLLPYESPKFGEGELAATREAQQLIANFVRFMDFLNHIKRAPQTANLKGGCATLLKRHQSLPASHTGFLSPMTGRSRTPTSQDPHSNISSPSSGSASLVTSPAPPRSRSRQRKLSEIDEEHQHDSSSGDSDQLRRKTSDQSLRSRTPDVGQQGQNQLRSHSPRVRDRERGRREHHKKSSKKSSRKPPIDARNSPDSSDPIGQGVRSGGDIFERGYDDEVVDTSAASRPVSPRPPKSSNNRSPLLLRRKSRDDIAIASSNKKDAAKDLQFGTTKSTKRDLSLDRMRSPRGSMKRKNVPVEVTPPTPVGEANKTIDSDPVSTSTLSSFDDGISILNTDSPPQLILKGLEDPENGIDCLMNQPGLKAGCFLAMEAVDWVMDRVTGATTRAEAVNVLQVLVSERLIIHASGDFQVPFVDGYFFYAMPHRDKQDDPPTKENMDRSFLIIDPMDFNTFSKCWFEVGVRHPSKLESPANTSLDPSPSFNSPIISLSNLRSQSPFYMDFEKQPETLEMPGYMANRYVELNPDPGSRSDRPEWCYVRYDHTYHPLRAFQFELQWMVTTIEIFHQLIQGWTHRANMCGFTLVAAPMLQSLSPSGLGSPHPFRRPLFIPLHLPPSMPDQQLPQFELITRVLSEIINSTGFLLDPGSRQKDTDDILSPRHQPGDFLSITSRFYIHHSGCSLIQPVCESISTRDGDPVIDQGLYADTQTPRQAMEARHTQEKHDHQLQGEPQLTFALPRSSSTPSASPVELKGLWLRAKLAERTMKCGFYWHRNHLLPKQKNIASSLLSQHDRVLSEVTKLCSGEDGRLDDIFEGLLNPKQQPPPPM